MKKILAFGASNSKNSINKILATYTVHKMKSVDAIITDLNDYELPIYSPHLEEEEGIPENARKFDELLASADGIIMSMAEHNGLHAAVFKNLFDWVSRINVKVWKNKPMLLMSTSPGGRGGANVLNVTKNLMPHFGGNVIADFSLPSFHTNFQEGEISDPERLSDLEQKVELFQNAIEG